MKKLKFKYFILIIILLILPSFFIFDFNPSNSLPILNNITNISSIPKDPFSYSSNEPPNGIIYANNLTLLNNNYTVRFDGGYTILDGGYSITENHLNGTPVLNSTVIENSPPLYFTRMISINLLNNAELLMKNINDSILQIFVFDNSKLTLESCIIKSVFALENSTVSIRNSTIENVMDTNIMTMNPQIISPKPASSNINILENSYIAQLGIFMGSTCGVDNSTISDMIIGGFSSGISMGLFSPNFTEPYNSAEITNSTITNLEIGGISVGYIFGSNLTSVTARELVDLTLNSTYVQNLSYGIICNNNTNISNGIPSGTDFSNNTNLIATNPVVSNLSSIAANSSTVSINGWPIGLKFELYLFNSASGNIYNTNFTDSKVFLKDLSKLSMFNSTINDTVANNNSELTLNKTIISGSIIALSYSIVTIFNCSSATPYSGFLYVATNNLVSVINSSFFYLMTTPSLSGSPIGKTQIINSTIYFANIFGSRNITLNNCSINTLTSGAVLYAGYLLLNSTGTYGTGSYTNYTKIIDCSINTDNTQNIEINNTAGMKIGNMTTQTNLYLMHSANATLDNASIFSISLYNNSKAFIYNSTLNTLWSMGNSNCTTNLNTSINTMIFSESSIGKIINTTVSNTIEIYFSANVTIVNSSINAAGVSWTNLTDFSLRIYNSLVITLYAFSWAPLRMPTSNHPADFTTSTYGKETIDWVLNDDVGSGKYRVWANDTNNNYYIWLNWTNWQNGENLHIPINRTAIGVFRYLIQFNNSVGQFGISDTVIITVRGPYSPPQAIIFARDSIIGNNTYSIRIDRGNTIVQNTFNLTEGKINGTQILNSTKLENSPAVENCLGMITLHNNASLIMINIISEDLVIYLYDYSELTLINCTVNIVLAADFSKVIMKNTTAFMVSDFESLLQFLMLGPTDFQFKAASSSIDISQNSSIYLCYFFMGSNAIIDNSSVFYMIVGGITALLPGTITFADFSEPVMQVTIKNSTMDRCVIGGIATGYIFGCNIFDFIAFGKGNVTLNATLIINLNYGVICSAGSASIINNVPSGNYYNNTIIINSPFPPLEVLISSAISYNSATLLIDYLTIGTYSVYILTYNNSKVIVNNSDIMGSNIYIRNFGNSQAEIKNSTIRDFIIQENSNVTIENSTIEGGGDSGLYVNSNSSLLIQNNCSINSITTNTINQVSIINLSIDTIICNTPILGVPSGNVTIMNSTILEANIYGSSIATLDNCTISNLNSGIIIYNGTFIQEGNITTGSFNEINYTTIKNCIIAYNTTKFGEINNTAALNLKDCSINLELVLKDNATLNLNNASLTSIVLLNNSFAYFLKSNVSYLQSYGNSSFEMGNSTINQLNCKSFSNGLIVNSTIDTIDLKELAALTVTDSVVETASISGANMKSYCMKIISSQVTFLNGKVMDDLSPISEHPEDIITYANGTETIEWVLYDNFGESYYRVWANDTNSNYYIWKNWTPWLNEVPLFVPINRTAAGVYNYTVEFNDSNNLFGIPDTVIVTIINVAPISNHPNDIITFANGTETIGWILTDDFGGGQYRIWVNNTNGSWIGWTNGSLISWPINRTARGIYNYTIEYYDMYNLYGIPDTVIVNITNLAPTSNHPGDIFTNASSTENITWVLYDDFGPGQYAVWAQDDHGTFYIWKGYASWTNNTSLNVPINRTAPGVFEYRILFYDMYMLNGIYDSVIVTIIDFNPSSNQPANIVTNVTGTENISWYLYDDFGGGQYRVWANDTNNNYYIWRDWNGWTNNTSLDVPINRTAPGVYNYTIQYYDNYTLYGTPDMVIVTITNANPTSNQPANIITNAGGTDTIGWYLYDDFGPGQYRVWTNDTNNNYYVWRGWNGWTNNTLLNVPINRTAPGIYNYTIEYYDMYNLNGIPDTIIVTITDAIPTSNSPSNVMTTTIGTENITWILYDDFGPGQYRVWANNSIGYYIWINWQSWTNASPLVIPINHTTTGVYNYTIEFYDNYNNYGIIDTVMVTVKGNMGLPIKLNIGLNTVGLTDDSGFTWLYIEIYVNAETNMTLNANSSKPASFPNFNGGFAFYNISLDIPSALSNTTIRFYYNETLLNVPESKLVIYCYNSTTLTWEPLNGTINQELNYIEITLYHLSLFIIGSTQEQSTLLVGPPSAADNFLLIIILISASAGAVVAVIAIAKTRKKPKVKKVEIKKVSGKEIIDFIRQKEKVNLYELTQQFKIELKDLKDIIQSAIDKKTVLGEFSETGEEFIVEIPIVTKEEKKIKKEKEKIAVKRAYDYVGGSIRFKVVVENKSDEIMRDISVLLNTREQFELQKTVDKIVLLDINESRGVDFMLTPMTCGKSTIYGTITYLDAKGRQYSSFMEPSVIQVKCPLVIPKITTSGDLKKLKGKLQSTRAEIKYSELDISKAYQIAKEQISSLDVYEIEEHLENYNVIYSGEAKVSGDQIIIDLNVNPNAIVIDVFLTDMKQATGFLAYIKNLINLSLQYSKQISTTLDNITTKIFNAFEFGFRLIELYNLCDKKENFDDIILLLKELRIKSNSYFPSLRMEDAFGKWIEDLEKIRGKEIWERTYINLQYYIITWLENIIVFSETNSKNYSESPSVDQETLKKIEAGNTKLKQELAKTINKYSISISFAVLVIQKASGLCIFSHNFKGEMLDSDLISGFLTAIRSFGAEFSKTETAMKKLSYESFEIELAEGEFTTPALITLGFCDELTKGLFNEFVTKFEAIFRPDLVNFTGNVSLYEKAKDLIKEIFG